MSSATCANEDKTSSVDTTFAVFCSLFIFLAISVLISTNALYSRFTTFSSAPKIWFSIVFNSSVIYLSPVVNVCFLINLSGTCDTNDFETSI